jgi:hypothetical protein
MPFEWGRHDCCIFAADAIEVMTGVDMAECLRGYTTALGAARRARLHGAGPADPFGVESWPALAFLEEIPPSFARRGDLILVSSVHSRGARLALSICLGHTAAVPGPDRLTYLGPAHWRRAWRIG